jgi:hypothetical protein
MWNRSSILATAVTLALAAGAGAAASTVLPSGAANAASLACGSACTAIAAQSWGLNYVTDVNGGGAGTVGEGAILARAVETNAEDFKLEYLATAATLYADGLVGSAVGTTWPSDPMYEYEYAPGGVPSSLCLGVSETAANGTAVTLQECGVTVKTVWMALSVDTIGGYQPLVNGTDTVTGAPYVLTAGAVGAALTTEQLSLADGTFAPSQMWQNRNGVYRPYRILPEPTRKA